MLSVGYFCHCDIFKACIMNSKNKLPYICQKMVLDKMCSYSGETKKKLLLEALPRISLCTWNCFSNYNKPWQKGDNYSLLKKNVIYQVDYNN